MNWILTIRCRGAQAAAAVREKFYRKRPPLSCREPGALDAAGRLLQQIRAKKPLVLLPAEPVPGRQALLGSLEEVGLTWELWQLTGEMTVREAENIRLYYIGTGCDSCIALGDEKHLLAAKMAAARIAHPRFDLNALAQKGLRRRLPPLMAIPTEPGGGAASPLGQLEELSLRDGRLCPRLYLEDETLMPAMDRPEQARLGMELLCRCVEALVSPRNKEARPRLRQRAELLLAALERLKDGGDIRDELLRRSLELAEYEGGYAWALSRAIGEQTLMKAGTAAAVCLPAVMELYAGKNEEIRELLAVQRSVNEDPEAGDPDRPYEEPTPAPESPEEETAPRDFLWRLRHLAWDLGMPESYEALNFDVEIRLARRAAELANPRWVCPVVWDWKALRDALRSMKA